MLHMRSIAERKRIALLCTLIVAIVLVGVFIVVYSKPKHPDNTQSKAMSALSTFYETISSKTQSFFNEK